MKQSYKDIQFIFYKIINHELCIGDFEKWLYDTSEIEEYLGKDFYFDLLSINYKNKHALEELEKLIYSKIPFSVFEKNRLESLLENIINRKGDLAEIISGMYDDYCNGYYFLRFLGLSYLLHGIDDVPIQKEKPNWNEEVFEKKRELLNIVSDDLIKESVRILGFLTSGEIKITNRYKYEDNRKEEDKIELNDLDSMYETKKDQDSNVHTNQKPESSLIKRCLKALKDKLNT